MAETINPKVFFDIDRIRNLEAIVQHFTNIQDFSPTQLTETVAALSKGSSTASQDPAIRYGDEASDDTPNDQATKDGTSILGMWL